MQKITLNDLLTLGEKTSLKEFYLPIDKTILNFDKKWLKNILFDTEKSNEEKLNSIKSHEYVQAGKINMVNLDLLNLQLLIYTDNENKPITRFHELVFEYGAVGMESIERFNEFDSSSINSLEYSLRMRPAFEGYSNLKIDPKSAKITSIGNFKIKSLVLDEGSNANSHIRASKTFEYEKGLAELVYFVELNSQGEINEFTIDISMGSKKKKSVDDFSDFLTRITVKKEGEKYIPQCEVTIKSERAEQMGSHLGLISYNFDRDGKFESIKLWGSKLNMNCAEIKSMEAVYSKIEGFVWYDGEYCIRLTDTAKKPAEINALITGKEADHYTIQAINKGKLKKDQDYELLPVSGLGFFAPGLTSDLLKIQHYKAFVQEFNGISFFKDVQLEDMGIDYIDTIQKLAKIQDLPANQVPLLQ